MSPSAQEESKIITFPSRSDFNRKTIILPVLVLFLGVALGFSFSFLMPKQPVQPQPQIITEADLPIGLAVLKNPAVYQWRGYVEGVLVVKDEGSITIKTDKGASIVIPVKANPQDTKLVTTFIGEALSRSGQAQGEIPLDEIGIGTRLRGDFWVLPGDKNKINGGLFQIVTKPGS